MNCRAPCPLDSGRDESLVFKSSSHVWYSRTSTEQDLQTPVGRRLCEQAR